MVSKYVSHIQLTNVMQVITASKVQVFQPLTILELEPLAQKGLSALLGRTNQSHVQREHMDQMKGCKAVLDVLIVMEESTVVMKD